ncbi:threonine-phosphate decarboxylase CobD [Parendozoicomonas sp. Alg238-R29]|uniref:threonine-phosphate decarboxylase CobD n=1 Tax=Parendozoicomonas sp. Alg238-R29 TaxID=2993446 RepID=UPI00248E1020|nr:threonine-phosphate decarboxylase CobD [Parendozoicomonas sp. Alg238-R29]
MLTHGGKLREASQKYNIPLEQWLDLSTGVNPRCYPVPNIPMAAWNRLPEDDDGLVDAACEYFQCSSLLPVAGSQAAIQALPLVRRQLFPESKTVAVPSVGYREHRNAWGKHDYEVLLYNGEPTAEQLDKADVVLVINPNNPTGHRVDASALMDWHTVLAERNSWLVVDEAFMDCTPEFSISHKTPLTNLVVLRSIGKFFGLAGIRMGFVLAQQDVLSSIQEHLGPWTVPGPIREIGKTALGDTAWQKSNRQFLGQASERLHNLLEGTFEKLNSTLLFTSVKVNNAQKLHHDFCGSGIFTRLLDEKDGLRFGLPEKESDWAQLEQALDNLS